MKTRFRPKLLRNDALFFGKKLQKNTVLVRTAQALEAHQHTLQSFKNIF